MNSSRTCRTSSTGECGGTMSSNSVNGGVPDSTRMTRSSAGCHWEGEEGLAHCTATETTALETRLSRPLTQTGGTPSYEGRSLAPPGGEAAPSAIPRWASPSRIWHTSSNVAIKYSLANMAITPWAGTTLGYHSSSIVTTHQTMSTSGVTGAKDTCCLSDGPVRFRSGTPDSAQVITRMRRSGWPVSRTAGSYRRRFLAITMRWIWLVPS